MWHGCITLYFYTLLRAAAATSLGRTTALPGVLLIKRDPAYGSTLEYRNIELNTVYHERIFEAARKSFDLTLDAEDVVVVADEDAGTVSRVTGPRSVVDQVSRVRPRAVSFNAKDRTLAWIEGVQTSMLSVSVFDDITADPVITQQATLDADGCTQASFAASFEMDSAPAWYIILLCREHLHMVQIYYPLPTIEDPLRPLQATSTPLNHDTDLSHVTGIATAESDSLLLAMSDGNTVCKIVRMYLQLSANEAEDIITREEVIYDCHKEASLYRLTGVAYLDNMVYLAQAGSGTDMRATSISRFPCGGNMKTPADLQVVLNRDNPLLPHSDVFSPSQLRVRSSGVGLTTVYWINTLDGRLRRYTFTADGENLSPLTSVLAEPSLGVFCPMAAVIIDPKGDAESPLVVWSDHGTNAIRQYQPQFSSSGDSKAADVVRENVLAYTASAPSEMLYVKELQTLFWIESELETIVAYSVENQTLLANLTYRLDPESTASDFASLAYLPKTGRIYVSDRAPAHPRILSWKAPHPVAGGYLGGGARVEWTGTDVWAPEALVGDPVSSLLYVSNTLDGTLYAIFLSPDTRMTHINLSVLPTPPMSADNIVALKSIVDHAEEPLNRTQLTLLETFWKTKKRQYIQLLNRPSQRPTLSANSLLRHQDNSTVIPQTPADYKSENRISVAPWTAAKQSVVSTEPQKIGTSAPKLRSTFASHTLPPPAAKFQTTTRNAPRERRLDVALEETVPPITRVFYRPGRENHPVRHMWHSNKALHWLESRQLPGNTVALTVLTKEMLGVSDPTIYIDEDKAYEFATAEMTNFVSYAAFYDIRRPFFPQNTREWVAISGAVAGVAIVAFAAHAWLSRRRSLAKNRAMYDSVLSPPGDDGTYNALSTPAAQTNPPSWERQPEEATSGAAANSDLGTLNGH